MLWPLLSRSLTLTHVTYFGFYLPWRAVQQCRRKPTEQAGPPRRLQYRVGMARTLQLGGISLVVAWVAGVPIFARVRPSASDIGLAVVACGVMILASLPPWRDAVATQARRVARWLPRDRRERLQWVVLCLIIGVTEEITWRGVQFALLLRLLGSWLPAALVGALMFGVVHVVQGLRWMYIAAAFAMVLQGLVWATGSLYLAMIIHAATDIAAGFYVARHWPRDRYPFISPSEAP